MSLTNEEIARAFSTHRFKDAVPHMADDVAWDIVGEERLIGRAAVAAACEKSSAYLTSGVTTEFQQVRAVVADDSVVIDTLAEYTDPAGDLSIVKSVDLYRFDAGRLTEITSYNVELDGAVG